MKTPPILFLPGTLCTGKMFEQQIQHLSQYCADIRVVQFTTENTLSAMAEKVVKAANQQACAMVGFSMGGIVALEVANKQPELIAKLAMINSNCHADLAERKAVRPSQIAKAKSGQLLELLNETFMPNYLYQANETHENIIRDMALELGAEVFAAQVMAIEDRPDRLSVLQNLQADILIIGGEQDQVCPADHQQLMHNKIKNSQLALLNKCAHFSPLEQTQQVNELLTTWYLK